MFVMKPLQQKRGAPGPMVARLLAGVKLKCSKCGERKAAMAFAPNRKNKTRRHSWCKACMVAAQAQYRKDKPEQWAATMRAYRARKSGKALCPACGYFTIKGTDLTDRQKAIIAYALSIEPGPAPERAPWCKRCGHEHAGPCALRYAKGHAKCAVPGCTRVALAGEELGRCMTCAMFNKPVSGACGYCKGNGMAANGTDPGENCAGCRGTGKETGAVPKCATCFGQGWTVSGKSAEGADGPQFVPCPECRAEVVE